MAKFHFKLQPVLDMRAREERDKQLVVAGLQREKLELESRIRQCQAMIEDERSAMSQALEPGLRVDLQSVKFQAGATLGHQFEAQKSVLELAAVFKRLNLAREELIQASARRKAVELLKEQQRLEFQARLNKEESETLDEMSVMRFKHAQQLASFDGASL